MTSVSAFDKEYEALPSKHETTEAADDKKKQKKKPVKMSLTSFLNTASNGSSWADESDLGPETEDHGYSQFNSSRASTFQAPSDASHIPSNIPSRPPFVVFIGNLPYIVEQRDVEEFFRGLRVVAVRLPRDPTTQQAKGFGYVELGSQDDMRNALNRSGDSILGRSVKVDIAEGKGSLVSSGGSKFDDDSRRRNYRREESRDSAALDGDWRAQGRATPSTSNYSSANSSRRSSTSFESKSRDDSAALPRSKLSLLPRTLPVQPLDIPKSSSVESEQPTKVDAPKREEPRKEVKKVNPFGDAKPRDETEAIKRIEEKMKNLETVEEKKPPKKKEIEKRRDVVSEKTDKEPKEIKQSWKKVGDAKKEVKKESVSEETAVKTTNVFDKLDEQ